MARGLLRSSGLTSRLPCGRPPVTHVPRPAVASPPRARRDGRPMNDPAPPAVHDDGDAGRWLRRRRRHATAGAADIATLAALPPVRIGLVTKLNLLTVGLIFLTAVVDHRLHVLARVDRRRRRARARRRARCRRCWPRWSTSRCASDDRAGIEQIVDSLVAGLERRVRRGPRRASAAPSRAAATATRSPARRSRSPRSSRPAHGVGEPTRTAARSAHRRYLEVVAPVRAGGAIAPARERRSRPRPRRSATCGSACRSSRSAAQFREQIAGALTVVAIVMLVAMRRATLLLTRRLVAPMRRLMRAARAVGARAPRRLRAGALVATSSGLLTHTFNHMTQRLAESQAEVASYQRTLEDKVAQRTRELEIATAHAYKLAQHDILTGLPNRSLLNQRLKQILAQAQRDGTQVALPVPRLRPLQAHQRHARPRRRRPAAAGDRAAADQRRARIATPSRASAATSSSSILPGPRPGARDVRGDDACCTRVRESFQAPFRLADQTPTLTCSIGVVALSARRAGRRRR